MKRQFQKILSAVVVGVFFFSQVTPSYALRVQQTESASGQEEIQNRLADQVRSFFSPNFAGLEETKSVEEALRKYFGAKSGRDGEIALEQFLAERWAEQVRSAADTLQSVRPEDKAGRERAERALQEAVRIHEEQIDEFVRLIEQDRRKAGVFRIDQHLGTYRLPSLDPKEVPAPGQKSGSGNLAIDIPSNRAYYELERLHLMARTAIQRALGREVVVNIGIGFVGTAVTTATAAESQRDFGKVPTGQKKQLQFRPPLEGKQNAYFTIAYQRPSPASAYKVPAVNSGVSPIATKDATVGKKIAETTQKGILIATFLSGSVSLADTVMLETELHVAKVLPTHLEHSEIQDEATVRLIRQVGQLMQTDALVIVESTIAPGFLRNKLLPAMNEELQRRGVLANGQNANLAHAFQRLEPGPRWYQSLLEQERVGAGVTAEANRKLEDYFRTVGFKYQIMSRVEAVEFMKTLENAWRFGLLELMSAYMRAGEIVGVDTFEVARAIARARPGTHGLISAIPSIQPGGYCVPKEMIQIVAALADYYGVSSAEIMEIFNTRFGAAISSDFRGRMTPARAAEALAAQGVRLDDARVHVMGITYAAGVADTRMSGVERAVREFATLGVAASQITVTDPYARSWPELQQQQLTSPESWGYGQPNQMGLSSLEVNQTVDPYATLSPDQDVILLGTRHPQYVGKARAAELGQKEPGLDPVRMSARMMGREGKLLVDTFDFFSDADYKQLLALGWKIRALGKGHINDLEQSLTTVDRIAAHEALLTELRALRGQDGVDPEGLSIAIEAAVTRLRYLKSVLSAESAKKDATQATRRETAQQNQALDQTAHIRQEIFYAQTRLAQARQWFDEDDARVARAQRNVRILQLRLLGRIRGEIVELIGARTADVAAYTQTSMVRPAMQKAAGIIRKSSFMHGVPARYLLTHNPVSASDEAKVDAAVSGPVTRSKLFLLAQYLDQALHMMDYLLLELFTPEQMAQILTDIRHREEAAHPERTLHPETRQIPYKVYGNDGQVAQETQVTVQMVHPVRWRTNLETGEMEVETDEVSWTNRVLKQLPDVRRTNIPDTWGRYFVLVKPRLVPVEGAEIRAYPPGFDDLPPELGMWLARDVVGNGMMLTTLSSPGSVEQDKVLLLMAVDPFGAGSGRAGHLVWADSLQPVVSVTPEGLEMPVSLKGIGLFVGGDDRFPHTSVETLGTTTGRRVSGGMSQGGTVGQSTLAQTPGFVTGVGSEHGLTALSVTNANYNGLSPRLVFGANFTFTHGAVGPSGQAIELFVSARQEPDTARMGWSFRGKPFDSESEVRNAAAVLGWNSAELLAHLPQPAIHIALSLDNVMANGYMTDPDSIVPPLYRERNPYGALYKYFGFSMQQTVMGWEQMKASKDGTEFEVEDRNLALMKPWLRSFLEHLLESGKVRREPFAKFDQLSRLSEDDFPAAVRKAYGQVTNKNAFNALAIDLIDTLWNHYLAYEILRNRLQYGYSHTVESTYTGTADERFDPTSAETAHQYLTSQRQILEVSQRLIQDGSYPPVAFDFVRALEEVAQREQRLSQLETESATDFREVYPLSFNKAEVKSVVAVLDISAVQAGDRALHIAGEVPSAASLVEKEVVTAGPKPADSKSGLEETLAQVVDLSHVQIRDTQNRVSSVASAPTVAVFLQAGASKRFDPTGQQHKIVAPLNGIPVGAWPIRSIEQNLHWPVISIIGQQADRVQEALTASSEQGVIFVRVEGDARAGTGHAAYHAAAVPGFQNSNAVVLLTVGDRPLYDAELFRQAVDQFNQTGADLILGVVDAGSPRQARGKGRVILGSNGRLVGIAEQPDINNLQSGETLLGLTKEELTQVTRVNGSLYVIRANRLFPLLANLANHNASGEYYVTDMVGDLVAQGGVVGTMTIPAEKAADITYPGDLNRLEIQLRSPKGLKPITALKDTVNWYRNQVWDPDNAADKISSAPFVAVFLQAGQDALFSPTGKSKLVMPLRGIPLGAWAIRAVQTDLGWPVISMVGHGADEVMPAIRSHTEPGLVFSRIDDPDGGTGYTAYSAGGVAGLAHSEGVVVVSVGDRPLYDGELFRAAVQRLHETGADLVIGVVDVENPDRALGRGRVVREAGGKTLGVVEQSDIDLLTPGEKILDLDNPQLDAITTINGSLYVMKASAFFEHLGRVRNDNTRQEFYLPSLVSEVMETGGTVQTVDIPLSQAAEVTFPEELEGLDTELSLPPGHHPGPLWARIRQVMIVSPDPSKRNFLKQTVEEGRHWVNVITFGNLRDALDYAKKMARREVPHCDCVFITDVKDGGGAAVWGQLGKALWPTPTVTLGDSAFSDGSIARTREMVQDNLERIGISEVFPLDLWRWIASDPERSGLRRVVERFVPEDQVELELIRIRDLVESAADRKVDLDGQFVPLFDPKAPVALSFAPGRVRFFMGHSDIRGSGGQTINAATHYGTWALTQVQLDGKGNAVVDNLDPKYQPFTFNLQGSDALPPRGIKTVRPDWLGWAETHENKNKWQGNIRAVPALIRTDFMDPEGRRRKEMARWSVRLLLAESTLPAGTGMASSSSLPGVFARGLQPFLSPQNRLTPDQLNNIDLVAYVGGDRAGTADMTAINTGQLGEVSVLYSFPERQGDVVTLPRDFKFFLVESGVHRIDAADQPPEVQNFASFIKSLTGMGSALADIWLRHLSRSRSNELGSLEQLLMTEPAGHPFGLLRELTALGHLTDSQYNAMVGGDTSQARTAFVERLLEQIPNDLTLGQILEAIQEPDLRDLLGNLLAGFTPVGAHKLNKSDTDGLHQLRMQTVIPLRQMAAYEIREIQRGLAYVEAARQGDAKTLIRLMRQAQDGDRAAWTLGPDRNLVLTPWGETQPGEAFFRSLPAIDATVDEFQLAMDAQFGEDSAAARIMAAGLGGSLAVGTTAEAFETARQWWGEHQAHVVEIQVGGGATSLRLPNLAPPAASAKASMSGFEETATLIEETRTTTPSASRTVFNGLGVVAGSDGFAWGVAIARNGKQADGRSVPVAFLISNDDQRAQLTAAGIHPEFIFTDETDAIQAISGYGVKPVLVGVTQPVTETARVLFATLFGMELSNAQADFWQGAYASAAVDVNA